MASVAESLHGEVFGQTPPRDDQVRLFTSPTMDGHMLSLQITYSVDHEYMLEAVTPRGAILFTPDFRENRDFDALLHELAADIANINEGELLREIAQAQDFLREEDARDAYLMMYGQPMGHDDMDIDADKENKDPNIDAMDAY